jgi:hypothetical protein
MKKFNHELMGVPAAYMDISTVEASNLYVYRIVYEELSFSAKTQAELRRDAKRQLRLIRGWVRDPAASYQRILWWRTKPEIWEQDDYWVFYCRFQTTPPMPGWLRAQLSFRADGSALRNGAPRAAAGVRGAP